MAARQPRTGPCLEFGFQYVLIRNNWSKNFGVEYWTLPGSNLPQKVENKKFLGPKKQRVEKFFFEQLIRFATRTVRCFQFHRLLTQGQASEAPL